MNVGIMLFIALAGIWALFMLFGAIGKYSHTLTTPASSIDSSSIQSQVQQRIDDTEAQRQQVMEDMRQKMEDARQR